MTTVNSALRALEYLGLSETCSTSLEPNVRIGVWRMDFLSSLDVTRCLRKQSNILLPSYADVVQMIFLTEFYCDLQKVAVDLIITDYCMPGMTGYELLKIVKV